MKELYRDRSFALIMLGKFVSLAGNAVYEIGLMWYVLSNYSERSGNILAWIMILGILPSVLLGGVIGCIIDRFNKKWIIVGSDIISGVTVLMITILMKYGYINTLYLLAATMILSITTSFVSISVSTIIPEILDAEKLFAANSVNQFVERITTLLGLSIGGVLVGFLGVKRIFLINAISFIVSAISEVFIVYLSKDETEKDAIKKKMIIQDFKEVYRFVKKNTNIFMITILFTLVNFLWDPVFNIVLPFVLKNTFLISSCQFGIIQAALPGGFCLGAMYFSKKEEFLRKRDIVVISILGANIMFTLFSVPIIFSNFFKPSNYVIAYLMIILVFSGIFSALINISTSTLIQISVPVNLRGKYWGISRSISSGMIPIGSAIVGALIGKIEPSLFFIVSAALVYIVIILVPRSRYFTTNKESNEMATQ